MEKRGRGRPRKFETAAELENKIDTYFVECDETNYTRGKRTDTTPYTVEGLCCALGICRETLRRYKDNLEFYDAIKKAKRRILADVMERGLTGRSDPVMTIFNLKNNFGYTDKAEAAVSVTIDIDRVAQSPLNGLTLEQLDAIDAIVYPKP